MTKEREGAGRGTAPRHMVAVRLSCLGDVILTTGALRWWHEQGGITFTVITKAAFAPIFFGHPAVDRIITLGPAEEKLSGFLPFCREMAGRFAGEPLVDLHGNLRSRLLSLFWKGEVFRYPKMAKERRMYLISHGHMYGSKLRSSHVTLRYAAAIPPDVLWPREKAEERRIGKRIALPCHAEVKQQIWLTAEERASAEAMLPVRTKPRVVLHPYSRHMEKSWNMPRWIDLAKAIAGEAEVIWVGQGNIPADVPGTSLVNRTDLRSLAAVIASCDVIVTGDSGPLHLAHAVGTSIVAMYGPTCLEWGFWPGGKTVRILRRELSCMPCSLHGKVARCDRNFACMNEISRDEVIGAIRSLIKEKEGTA